MEPVTPSAEPSANLTAMLVNAATSGAWADLFQAALGGSSVTSGLVVGSFASIGFVAFCVVIPYCYRLARGHDVITECRVGKARVTLTIDATGNGVHAAKKLVFDVAKRQVSTEDTGLAESPTGSTRRIAPKKTRAGSETESSTELASVATSATLRAAKAEAAAKAAAAEESESKKPELAS